MAVKIHPDCDFMSWQKPSLKKCPEGGCDQWFEQGK